MVPGIIVVLLAAFALVECARVMAGFRRAVRLNRAMHELRRPMQSISLSIEGCSPDLRCAAACLEQARGALEELDAVINRRRIAPRVARTALEDVAAALEDRWRFAGVEVDSVDPRRAVDADPLRLGAALDNLVANAVEHGSAPVTVRALSAPGSVRIEVWDGGSSSTSPGRMRRDPRRGHGLTVAGDVAASGGGTVIPPRPRASGGTMAALSLPVSMRSPATSARAADSG